MIVEFLPANRARLRRQRRAPILYIVMAIVGFVGAVALAICH